MSSIPVYVINLAWQPDRMDRTSALLGAAGFAFERVEAIDGRSLDSLPPEVIGQYDQIACGHKYTNDLTPGEVAAYLSHLQAHKAFLAGGADVAIVLEDDCALTPEFSSVIERILEADLEWDLLKLCGVGRWSFVSVAQLGQGYQVVDYAKYPKCMYATLVRRSGSRKLLERGLPFSRPIDIDLQHWWERDMRMLSVFPPIAHEAGLHDSAIRSLAGPATKKRRALSGVLRHWYRQQRFRNTLMVRQVLANVGRFGLGQALRLSLTSFTSKFRRKGLPEAPEGTRH